MALFLFGGVCIHAIGAFAPSPLSARHPGEQSRNTNANAVRMKSFFVFAFSVSRPGRPREEELEDMSSIGRTQDLETSTEPEPQHQVLE